LLLLMRPSFFLDGKTLYAKVGVPISFLLTVVVQ
jgi:hypothetical protein